MTASQYFSHDANATNDPKIIRLIEGLGPEGYGIFWILVEALRTQEPAFTFPMDALPGLARRYNSTSEKFTVVVKSFGLFTITDDDRFFYSESLLRRMDKMNELRSKRAVAGAIGGRQRALNQASSSKAQALLEANPSKAQALLEASPSKSKQLKEKEIKEKEIKTKKNKEESISGDPFFYLKENFNPDNALGEKWKQWIDFRKKLKKPYKTKEGETGAFKRLMELSDGDTGNAIRIIEQSVANEWQGLFPLKVDTVTRINKEKNLSAARLAYEASLLKK